MSTAAVAVTHVQIVFAAVDELGIVRRPPLPLDVHVRMNPGDRSSQGGCREHGYANGDRGLWLVAWVNRVDVVSGGSWIAPTGEPLTAAIQGALP